MKYSPIKITGGHWGGKNWDLLFARCRPLKHYLAPLLDLYVTTADQAWRDAKIAVWESTAPRPAQRMEALRECEDGEPRNLILYGRLSGSGKTTVACEVILRSVTCPSGAIAFDDEPPLILSGHGFARIVAGQARDLDDLMTGWIVADPLLLDDLDKRGDASGKLSPIVQQTLFELVEARSTDEYATTILTLNATGAELEAKFDDDIGPYLLRRLRERFRSIDFDPVVQAELNILQMKATA
jgi:hypothetical protein